MAVPGFLGASDAILGAVLALGWVVVLGSGLYQYTYGSRSRERFYSTLTAGSLWLAFSLFQLSSAFSNQTRTGVEALAVGVFCAGLITGVQWVRIRNSGTDASGAA